MEGRCWPFGCSRGGDIPRYRENGYHVAISAKHIFSPLSSYLVDFVVTAAARDRIKSYSGRTISDSYR